MVFTGWPEEALDFYDGLAADNTKTYWTANKPVYEEKVLSPMAELVEELAADFGETKIFRPYRDVRFSKDKTPYKTHIGAMVGTGYVQLSAHGLAAGDGMYVMAPDQLDRYRQAVASDRTGPELEQVIAAIEQAGIGVSGRGTLKSAPRGYPADHPRIGLLRCTRAGRLAGMAGRGLAGDCGGPGPGGHLPAHHAAAERLAGHPGGPAAAAPERAR